MNYREFLDQIYLRHASNVKLGLERMEVVLAAMNHPETQLHGVHVAGTNGKGSTCAIFEALALAHGRTTGMNTSPHLVDYRERFRINGEIISENELMDAYYRREKLLEANEATFFEITTALAFDMFRELELDTAIIEVGLGGRLDGTRPFTPEVTAITGISIDHPKTLGDTVEKIAFEKSGILKPDTPVVMGAMPESAAQVIIDRAHEIHAPILRYGQDFWAENVEVTLEGTKFDYHAVDLDFKGLTVNLLGEHQARNAAVALTAFANYSRQRGFDLDPIRVRNALLRVNWPGRMQIMRTHPLVILDGAHNEEGVGMLLNNLKALFPGRKFPLVLAILEDKPFAKMIASLCGIASRLYIASNPSERAASVEQQAELARVQGFEPQTFADVVTATRAAVDEATPDDVVVVTGSLYTIAEVLARPADAVGSHE